jgi:hypothetical protein
MQIKFRGERIDHEECTPPYKWVYGYYFKTPLTAENCGLDSFLPGETRHCIATEEGVVYEVIPDTVGQYIGHKDEVNTEIYYGDIIDNDDYIFLVRNALYGCYLEQLSSPEDEDDEDWSAYLSTHPITDNSKIIGNVWDNPELLTK